MNDSTRFITFDRMEIMQAFGGALAEHSFALRRQHIATAVLAGFAACPKCHDNAAYEAKHFAHSALQFADELIAQIDKPKETTP